MTAIDLGSNTIRFLNYDCIPGVEKASFEKVVRTAEGLHRSGAISDGAIARIIDAIGEAREAIGIEENVKATATAAFRQANNSDKAIAAIARATGITFEIIDAETEADLAAMAVYEAVRRNEPEPSLLILDIGGASTEIMYKDESHTRSQSFDVGIVTSANRFGEDETALAAHLRPMLHAIADFVRESTARYGKAARFTATAGTPTTLAAIKLGMNYATYDKAKINGTVLSLKEINDTYNRLLKMDEETRERLVGSKRGDLVMCGVVIFREIFKQVGYTECMVFDDGLREGIAISACRNLRNI